MRFVILLALVVASLAVPVPIEENSFSKFHTINYQHYWNYEEVVDYMRRLEAERPDIALVVQMGRSEQGRDIFGIRIVNAEHLAEETLPVVLVTAGANARDWITVMSAVNIIHMLVEHHHTYRYLVDDLEWIIIPIANPDGYEFSMSEGNRAWVKNRRVNNGSTCIGVNVERNFDFNWGLDIDSSADPCADNFRGTSADSEEETRTIQFAVDIFRRVQRAYVSLKAGRSNTFNGMITYPFAFSNEAVPNNWEDQQNVAWAMSNNLRSFTGARYLTGSFSNLAASPAAAVSMDYAAGVDDIPLPYTIFTPPSGEFGWDVEVWRINPVVDQIFFAMEHLGRHALEMPLENKNKPEN